MPLLIFIALFTLLDFIVLFSIGAEIGLLSTLVLIFATGFLGFHLVRREGVSVLKSARQRMALGEMPSSELMTGTVLIFGGALLMAPGFLSDILGALCLLPTSRHLLGKLLSKLPFQMRYRAMGGQRYSYRSGDEWPHGESQRKASGKDNDEAQPKGGDESRPLEGEFISRDERHR